MDTSQIHFHWATTGTPCWPFNLFWGCKAWCGWAFNLHFPDDWYGWALFHRFIDHSISFFVKCLFKSLLFLFLFFFWSFVFFKPPPQHMEFPRLGVELELQLPACATATATWDPSHVCYLHHSSWQWWILNPLSKARNQTCVLVDASQICFHWATIGTPCKPYFTFHILDLQLTRTEIFFFFFFLSGI